MMSNIDFSQIEQKFSERREYWMNWISDMNENLKQIDNVVNLQSVIFTKRQEAVENYHNLAATIAKRSKIYKENSAKLYNDIRLKKVAQGSNSFMYSTESAIKDQIEATLSDEKYLIDIMQLHLNYIENTIKTIDNIIYAISNRIRIEEIKIGK